MQYRAVGLMSGSSLDGLDIIYAEFKENGNRWSYEIKNAACIEYNDDWISKLRSATHLSAYEYLLLHVQYGKFIAEKLNEFIDANELHHKVQLIASHGHTTFHAPVLSMTAQLGDGATIAALTGINVVNDLRMMDVALGGQGAPIVPIGEKLLFSDYQYFLNLGGIANVSASDHSSEDHIAFDVCPANRVLNLLANRQGKPFDDGGKIAQKGSVNTSLLTQLNRLDYYKRPHPKSLANNFGTDTIYPLITSTNISVEDGLRTYVEHIVQQIVYAVNMVIKKTGVNKKLLVTGGGAFNNFLITRLKEQLEVFNIEVVIPEEKLIKYKEALIMALSGILRWREENTVISSVTGAVRSSIGGAVWIGQEA
jgi:anhydro-N-acetylmuramic acid kinase